MAKFVNFPNSTSPHTWLNPDFVSSAWQSESAVTIIHSGANINVWDTLENVLEKLSTN
jgi:hypothetical protein